MIRYGVPYFKDTTPSWSTRGKLRNQLIPLLIDMYGIGCLHNLSALATESSETQQLVNANVYSPFLKYVHQLLLQYVLCYLDAISFVVTYLQYISAH